MVEPAKLVDQTLGKVSGIIDAVDVFGLYSFTAQMIRFSSLSFSELRELNNVSNFAFTMKIISVVLTIIFFFGIIYFFRKLVALKKKKGPLTVETKEDRVYEPASGGMVTGKWKEIMDHMESRNKHEWKLAVIEADQLVNDLLKKAGFPGETMGERLTNTHHDQLRTLHYLWQAHRLRNRIAHESEFDPNYKDIREALGYFQATLEELGVL